jgi:ankyrin repeat protein
MFLICCGKGSEDVVKVLLNAGADVNIADNTGVTPLFAAALLGKTSIVQILMVYTPGISQKDKFTPFHTKSYLFVFI